MLYRNEADQTLPKKNYKSEYGHLKVNDSKQFSNLKHSVKSIIEKIFNEKKILYNHFELSKYHKYCRDFHQKKIESTRSLKFDDLNIDTHNLCEKVSEYLNKKVKINHKLLPNEIVILRISRPNSLDINPPHREAYLDIWKNNKFMGANSGM